MTDLTMVVPTYNEAARLGELVQAVFDACDRARVTLELVIVDDNSPDGTGPLAESLAAGVTAPHRMQVVRRAGKQGLGTAVVAGFNVASSDIVGVMDADFSHPPVMVPKLLAAMRALNADAVVGSRYIPGGSTPDWPWSRRLLSQVACVLASPISPVRDATSGFFLIRRDVARGVSIQAGGFKICLELLARAAPAHVAEVPFQFDDRELGESKMSAREGSGYLVQLRDLLWLRLRNPGRRTKKYTRLSPEQLARLTP
jgi:dolichol-phosphate mannosyltransferase